MDEYAHASKLERKPFMEAIVFHFLQQKNEMHISYDVCEGRGCKTSTQKSKNKTERLELKVERRMKEGDGMHGINAKRAQMYSQNIGI